MHTICAMYGVRAYGYSCKHSILVDTGFNKLILWCLIFAVTLILGYAAHKYLSNAYDTNRKPIQTH